MRYQIMTTLALAALVISCSGNQSKSDDPIHSVMLVQPEGVAALGSKTFSGQVEEGREISVGFKTAGQLTRILVKEGDYVRQGQLIAQLDDKDYKLGVDAAQIQYDQMKREVARMKKLYDNKSLSGNDYDKAVSGLGQLKVQLDSKSNQLSYTRLYAPTSGYVKSVNFEAAEMVNAGTAIINLLDVKQMEVTINIPTSLYLQKDKIKGFSCKGNFSEGQLIPLKLLSITPQADNNQLYRVRLGLQPDQAKKVTSGMNVEVSIDLDQSAESNGLTLPLSAVFQKEGKSYVWVYDSKTSTVKQTAVTVEKMNTEGKAVIIKGLSGEEQVVKAGALVLDNGEKVKVIAKPSKTNVGGLI